MNKKISLKANVIYNMLKTVSSLVFPLISFPYISRTLLTESVGKFNFGNSIVSYFALFAGLGISTYAIRECSKVRDDKEKLNFVASQLLTINMITTLIAYVLLGITLIFAPALKSYRLLIVIQSSVILFTTIGADWMNNVMEDFKFITIRSIAFQVISLCLMFIFIHKPEDYLKYALISVFSSSAANITNVFYRRRYCRLHFVKKLDLKTHIPPILWLFSSLIALTIFCNTDQTILGLIRGDHEVGLYSTSVKIYSMINTTFASIAFVVMPKMSNCFATGNYDLASSYFKKACSFIVVLGLPCVIGLGLIAEDVIALVGGPAYADAATSLRILSLAMACSFVGGLIGNVVNIPSGREKVGLLAAGAAAIVNLVLNFILIPYYGLNAAAFTTFVAEAVSLAIVFALRDRRVSINGIKEIILAPIIAVIAMSSVVILCKIILPSLVLRTAVTVAGSAACYFSVLLLMKHKFTMEMITPTISRITGIFKKR